MEITLLDYVKARRATYALALDGMEKEGSTYLAMYDETRYIIAELDHLIQIGTKVPTYKKTTTGYDPRETRNINPTYPSQFDDQPSGSQWRDR